MPTHGPRYLIEAANPQCEEAVKEWLLLDVKELHPMDARDNPLATIKADRKIVHLIDGLLNYYERVTGEDKTHYCDEVICESFQPNEENENDHACLFCQRRESEHGNHSPAISKKVVSGYFNVYETTRHCGGPEEGGWWYNWDACVLSVPCQRDQVPMLFKALAPCYISQGNIYSSLGGELYSFYFEKEAAEHQTKARPHYE